MFNNLRYALRQLLKNPGFTARSEEHTSELQSQSNLVCRLLLEKKKSYRVHAIVQTPAGLMLFETDRGLAKYAGQGPTALVSKGLASGSWCPLQIDDDGAASIGG